MSKVNKRDWLNAIEVRPTLKNGIELKNAIESLSCDNAQPVSTSDMHQHSTRSYNGHDIWSWYGDDSLVGYMRAVTMSIEGDIYYLPDSGRSPLGSYRRGLGGGLYIRAYHKVICADPQSLPIEPIASVATAYDIGRHDVIKGFDEMIEAILKEAGQSPQRGILVLYADGSTAYRSRQISLEKAV